MARISRPPLMSFLIILGKQESCSLLISFRLCLIVLDNFFFLLNVWFWSSMSILRS